jgi:NMD protein affecting ribosome stability and mRNA decay
LTIGWSASTRSLIRIICRRAGAIMFEPMSLNRGRTMKADRGGWRPLRREELRDELVHDSYKSKRKLSEPTYCPECNAVYHSGRWQWGAVATGAHQTLCPACRRTHDKFPAGYVTLKGEFVATHRDEILQLIRNREAHEKAEHALERIMSIEDVNDDGVLITTTGTHLARDISEAVHAAYKGELQYHYNKEENLLRASWTG